MAMMSPTEKPVVLEMLSGHVQHDEQPGTCLSNHWVQAEGLVLQVQGFQVWGHRGPALGVSV